MRHDATLRQHRFRAAVTAAGLLAVLALLAPRPADAAARAWLDRDTVDLGDTVTLNIETDRLDAEPDISPLSADFELLGTSSRSQVVHGSAGSSVSALRAVVLEPKRAGTLTVPALQVGDDTTEPLTLTVRTPTPTPAGPDQDVFLEIEAEPRNPYVQQQVRYTLRLYYAVTLLEGQLEEPQAEHIEVQRLGQDRSAQSTIGGRRYNVVERHYALVPERSGTLTIAAATFRGRAILPNRRSTWIGAGAPVAARGEPITLEVRPRPDTAVEPWLPAASLALEDDSDAAPETLRIGEPWTLTLRARARGLGASQLPELELPAIEGAEVYPDQAVARDTNEGGWMLGERERKFAIVPHTPGVLRIPAMELHWWDTGSDQPQVARIPARELRVVAGAGAGARADAVPDAEHGAADVGAGAWHWPLLAVVFALLWLATLAWAWRARRAAVAAPGVGNGPVPDTTPASARLRRALAQGDLDDIAGAIAGLARAQGLPAASLGALAGHLDDAAQRDALSAIESARFGRGDAEAARAAREAARAAFAGGRLRARTHARPTADADPLPPLYP